MKTNGAVKINNNQRNAFAKLIENKIGTRKDEQEWDTRKEKAENEKLEVLKAKHAKDIKDLMKAKEIERRLKNAGLETDYNDKSIQLTYQLREKVEKQLVRQINNVKEKAIRDVWSSQNVDEAKAIVNSFLALYL